MKNFTTALPTIIRGFLRILVWLSTPLGLYGQDGFVEGEPRLAYWKVGQQRQTVIVLHGGPGAPHQYLRPEFDALSQTSTLIYYDQRGCGKSESAPSYIWQDHVADLKTTHHDPSQKPEGDSGGLFLGIRFSYTLRLYLSGGCEWIDSIRHDNLAGGRKDLSTRTHAHEKAD